MGSTRLRETSRDLLPGTRWVRSSVPSPGAERKRWPRECQTVLPSQLTRGSLLSLDKYFDSSPHHQSPPASSPLPRPPASLPTAPQPFPLSKAWTASARTARCRGKSSPCPDASQEAVYLSSFSFLNREPKPRARFYSLGDALGLHTRAGLRANVLACPCDAYCDFSFHQIPRVIAKTWLAWRRCSLL